MTALTKLTLTCPVRGQLKATSKSKDGLTPSEEFQRVQAIRHLIRKGYPTENFLVEPVIKRFGNSGRNSFRSDFAVLDVPIQSVDTGNIDDVLAHALVLCEVKRQNKDSDYVKKTQVEPLLDFAKKDNCIALYWDDVEQRVFWEERSNAVRETREGPLSFLPSFGAKVTTKEITFDDTKTTESLTNIFGRIEDILHQSSFDAEQRYPIILQLLLAKIFDEHAFEGRPQKPLAIQDFSSLGTSPDIALQKFNKVLDKAVSFYGTHLPNPISKEIPIPGNTLLDILKILAPVRIIHSRRSVIQSFYMKFAKDLYRWDLAQYFTPTQATDFIVQIANPQFGEHVADPACGSADFLVAAFRIGREFNHGYADNVWGVDNSSNAVQVAVLNMLLNGDGKTNISKADSLSTANDRSSRYDILLCNPPFGTRIIETRSNVLKTYELAREWKLEDDKYKATSKVLSSAQTGILFAEVCVKECKPGGRIGIILPNGYLGNRSFTYRVFREWLLRNVKIAAIVSFPRFTFKSSGADVSASVLFAEKRHKPLEKVQEEEFYFAVEMIENLGWEAGNKRAETIYRRNQNDGSFIIDENGDLIIDSDFPASLERIRSSEASNFFEWLRDGQEISQEAASESWSVPINVVYGDPDLTLDPKRYCKKVLLLRDRIKEADYFLLGDVVDFIPEKINSKGLRQKKRQELIYRYVQLDDMGCGEYSFADYRGWQLPDRAKHFAESGDLYFGSIWGSVAKWCFIGDDGKDIVVTNGCHRCRIKQGHEEKLIDIVAFLVSEAWAVQMRSYARGSDGLAEITVDDAKQVIIPVIESQEVRDQLSEYITDLKQGRTTIRNAVTKLISKGYISDLDLDKRPSHIVLV